MNERHDTLEFAPQASGWRRLLLAEIVDVLDKKRKPITKRDRIAGPYPYYGATGVLDWVDGYLFDEPLILIGEDGAKWEAGADSAFAIFGKTWVNNHAHVLRPNRDCVIDDWLVYYLNATNLSEFISGMTVPKLNQGQLRQIPIPVPPIDEQKRIVAVLDQAFAALDRGHAFAEENLKDVSELFENNLLGMFESVVASSPQMTLASAAQDFSRGKSKHRPRNDPSLYNGEYPFIQTGDIRRSGGVIREHSQTYNEKGLAQSKYWPSGTVCITIAANIAETGVLEFDGCFPDSVIGMIPNTGIATPYYVEYMLRFFAKELKLQGKGSAQDNINLATFEEAKFPFPDLRTQAKIVEQLDQIAASTSDLRSRYTQELADIEDLRQSLLQQAFTNNLI